MSLSANIETSLHGAGVDPLYLFVGLFFVGLIAFAAMNPKPKPKPVAVQRQTKVYSQRKIDKARFNLVIGFYVAVWFVCASAFLVAVVASFVAQI